MAFQRRSKNTNSVRITGLFASRNKRGLYVGTARPEDLKALGAKMKEALAEGKGMAFFLWKNEAEEGKPLFNLTAAVAMDRDDAKPAKRRLVPVDDDEPEAEDDLPF